MNRMGIGFTSRIGWAGLVALTLASVSLLAGCGTTAAEPEERVGARSDAIETCTNGVCPETCGACVADPASPLGGYKECRRAIGGAYRTACTPTTPTTPAAMTCTRATSGTICIQKCCAGAAGGGTGCGFTPCPPARSAMDPMPDFPVMMNRK